MLIVISYFFNKTCILVNWNDGLDMLKDSQNEHTKEKGGKNHGTVRIAS